MLTKRRERPSVSVEQNCDHTTLKIFARNSFTAWLIAPFGALAVFGALVLALQATRLGDFVSMLGMLGTAGAALWVTWWFSFRTREFKIIFSPAHLVVGKKSFAYSDIKAFGVAESGGDSFDPVSMAVPRNITFGPHIFIDLHNRRLPITIGLSADQAKEALDRFSELFETYSSNS